MKKIAINGFGRIGKLAARIILETNAFDVVGVNDLEEEKTLKESFKNDPVYGKFNQKIKAKFFQEKDPLNLPWEELGVDVVLECTGFFRDKKAVNHIKAGAKKVIISAPSKDDSIPVYILGVNEKDYNKEDIISMGSCTTNATAPVMKILDKELGVKKAFLNTIHSYTASQGEWIGKKDLSIIPTTTGATKTVERVLPQLKGKLDGLALRVPTKTVSIVELCLEVSKEASKDKINSILKENEIKGIFKVEKRKLDSLDYRKNEYSGILDANLTQSFRNFIRVFVWYDNEWAYAKRLVEMAKYISK